MANFKTPGGDRVLQFIFDSFANERPEVALGDTVEERAHFVFLSVNLNFHATVQQVAYPAGDIEALGYMSHRPAETNPLNVALVKYLERDHASFDSSKGAGARKCAPHPKTSGKRSEEHTSELQSRLHLVC